MLRPYLDATQPRPTLPQPTRRPQTAPPIVIVLWLRGFTEETSRSTPFAMNVQRLKKVRGTVVFSMGTTKGCTPKKRHPGISLSWLLTWMRAAHELA